jgi:hypothetical protein
MADGGGTVSSAGRHARRHYKRACHWARHPLGAAEAEAHHLHEVEQSGESGETPYVAVLGLLIFLLPIAVVMLLIALGAAWLFG